MRSGFSTINNKKRLRSSLHMCSFLVFLTFVLCMPGMGAAAQEGTLSAPTGAVLLVIAGDIQYTNHLNEAHFDQAMINSLPSHTVNTSTAVTDGVNRFDGVLIRDLLHRVGAKGETVSAHALNDYIVDIPAVDFQKFDVILASHMDGQQLEPTDKGPFWIVYPRDEYRRLQDIRYDYRWVWQLNRLTVK